MKSISYPLNPLLETMLNRLLVIWGLGALVTLAVLLFISPVGALSHGVCTLFWAASFATLIKFSEVVFIEQVSGGKLAAQICGLFIVTALLLVGSFAILRGFEGSHLGGILSTILFLGSIVVERIWTLGRNEHGV